MTPYYNNRPYHPVTPQADSEELAAKSDRLILQHQMGESPVLVVAPMGELTAGWVVGLLARLI